MPYCDWADCVQCDTNCSTHWLLLCYKPFWCERSFWGEPRQNVATQTSRVNSAINRISWSTQSCAVTKDVYREECSGSRALTFSKERSTFCRSFSFWMLMTILCLAPLVTLWNQSNLCSALHDYYEPFALEKIQPWAAYRALSDTFGDFIYLTVLGSVFVHSASG